MCVCGGVIYGHIAPIFWMKMHLSDLGSGYTAVIQDTKNILNSYRKA